MCGIAGFWDLSRRYGHDQMQSTIRRMSDTLVHRGPNDSGVWVDAHAGIAFGHRRLSIIDLSPQGHQPMSSPCGRFIITFNGEIYNYSDIRRKLEEDGAAPKWRGHSDTEVMLAAIACWGLEKALSRFIGMFAFALWDREKSQLTLVRDRLGEKPLYYGVHGKTLLFGSELKALHAHPDFQAIIDRNVLALYIRYNYIPAPYSIYKNIYKLMPGTILSINAADVEQHSLTRSDLKQYWYARDIVEQGVHEQFVCSEAQTIDKLDSLLRDSVKQQMVADVPIGVFLSGGIDSSTVAALMQSQSGRPVRTFTIGFRETDFSEAEHAKAVARHLGTDHTELYVTAEQVMGVVPQMATIYDEPFADASQVPTFILSQLTRKHVTVSLSGDGGDELFGGYNRHFWGRSIWRISRTMPLKVRHLIAHTVISLSPQRLDQLYKRNYYILPKKYREKFAGERLHKLANIFAADSPESMYRGLISRCANPTSLVLDAIEPQTVITDRCQWPSLDDLSHNMMYLDMVTYLPDDILVKVDRAGMGVSLETRMPFLDHRVVEFAWHIPLTMNIRQNQGKQLLRKILYKYVPKELAERPKMGFDMPIGNWLRGPLRDWAESLLTEDRLRADGYFAPSPIRQTWIEHLSWKRNWQHHLWSILMFQAWLQNRKYM